MKSKTILYISLGALISLSLSPELMATTTDSFGHNAIQTHATNIKNFVFGAPIRIAGVIGGAYGLVQSFLSSSPTPFLTFGGIGLVANIIPTFIDNVVGVSSMLLP